VGVYLAGDVGVPVGFADVFAIGANDVANSFSTAVASKTTPHRQAIVLDLSAEFPWALVLGSTVV
jgi:sodium-dependent phosphate transporter